MRTAFNVALLAICATPVMAQLVDVYPAYRENILSRVEPTITRDLDPLVRQTCRRHRCVPAFPSQLRSMTACFS